MSFLLTKRYGLNAAICAFLAVSGCTTQPVVDEHVDQSAGQEVESAASGLPNVELDSELLYHLLLGELAFQRGDFETASKALSTAATQSRDYRLAEHATRVSLRAKDYNRAQQSARLWSALRPQDSAPLEVIAMALVEDGQIDAAQVVVEDLLDRKGKTPGTVYRRLAELLSRQPNHQGALGLMSRLVDLNLEDPEIYYAQAYLADRLNESDLVIESIDRALALKPGWEEAALAKAAHLAGDQEQEESAIAFSEGFLNDYPDSNRLRLYYARFLVDRGELDQGLDQFVILIEREPGNADVLYAAGLLAIQLERYEDAEQYLAQNLQLRPGNDQVRLYMGQLAIEREDYADALELYKAVQSESFYFEAQLSITDILSESDGVDAALEHLETLYPVNQEEYVRWVLAKEQVLRKVKRLDEAKAVLDSAVGRYPEDNELIYARGLLAAQLNLLDVHEQDMRKLLVKDPENAHALNALGYTLADTTDRYEEAQSLIEQALSIRPEDPFILDSMGWVQYRLGNHSDAISYLERALTKRNDAEIAAHLGEVLWVNGDEARAREIWQLGLEQGPENDVLLNTIKKFDQ
jgi:tetratricopeptide (TPR) repeat protein